MFIVTAKAPRRSRIALLAALCALAAAAILLARGVGTSDADAPARAGTEAERVAYLAALGWEIEPECVEMLRLRLPESMEEPYRSYNELQRKQGFDLTPYLGETLERYTYVVTNHPSQRRAQADLYVCEGEVVAGDIVCTGENGFIDTLDYPADQQDNRA